MSLNKEDKKLFEFFGWVYGAVVAVCVIGGGAALYWVLTP